MRYFNRKIRAVLNLALLFVFCCQAKAQNVAPNVQTILMRMIATYARASSYEDSGVVRYVQLDPLIASRKARLAQNVGFQSDKVLSFKTYYSRPSRFRFDWKVSSQTVDRYSVVWFDGKKAYSWTPTESGDGAYKLTSNSNLGASIDQILSPSLGSAYTVPSLLLQNLIVDPFSRTLQSAKRVSLVSEEVVDGERCYVIKADLSGIPWVLWVGKESLLLRKTRTLYSAGSFHPNTKNEKQSFIGEEIHTNIKINRRMPKRLFKYRPLFEPRDLDLTGSR